jgi:hypothetical protein
VACDNKVTAPDRIVNPPGNIIGYGHNKSITVSFYGNNIEEGFQGYNVYIAQTPGITVNNAQLLTQPTGIEPTLPRSSPTCFPDARQRSYVTVISNATNNIVTGQSYYLAVLTVLQIGNKEYLSDLTHEVLVPVGKYSNIVLFNQQINGRADDGVEFTNLMASNMNVPDTISPGTTGDLFFKLEQVNGNIIPVLSVEDNLNEIQDAGYAEDIHGHQGIPSGGYIQNGFITAVENHVYYLYLKNDNQYVKLYIASINGVINNIDDEVSIEIEYIF